MTATLFERDGDAWRPMTAALAVWHCSIHPAAVAALVAAEVEAFGETQDMPRLTLQFDLHGPVPEDPLRIRVWGQRRYPHGRFVEGELLSGERGIGRISGCVLKENVSWQDGPKPGRPSSTHDLAGASFAELIHASGGPKRLRSDGIEHRALVWRSAADERQYGFDLPIDLAPGRPLSPTMKLAATAGIALDLAAHDRFPELLGLRKQGLHLHLDVEHVPAPGPFSLSPESRGSNGLHLRSVSSQCKQGDAWVGSVSAGARPEAA